MAELWCLHVLGPDDLHAAPSKEEAERVAREMTATYRGTAAAEEGLKFQAAAWPWSAASHAEDVKLWDGKFRRSFNAGGEHASD